MRTRFLVLSLIILLACDGERVFEKNTDFNERYWPVKEKPEFTFEIPDTALKYNLYCNIRNTLSYPYSRLFVTYYLSDTTGQELKTALIKSTLFDPKTGEPQGSSGLGDIYDHQIDLLKNYSFKKPGKYKIRLEQFMRTDSLQGILAVGVRIEKSTLE